ncbi:3'-5' exonuclease [Neolewinella antarctica]|uniref:DNA polymerase-3 subunit epsilon n=1 Tax=Neolewinella antarctica TaxID=442734 RepID=A0ABX0XDS9_9BACT|nr:3'-5' exonuclease [Neolewinella antarctica]NJC27406.1 DNA polymerase-3 subunit epsilon [Neolewinella antarctica]
MAWWNKLLPGESTRIDPDWPVWYQQYTAACLAGTLPGSHPLSTARICVVDAETTGLDVKKDRLLSLAGLPVTDRTIFVRQQFEAYLPTPPDQLDHRAVAIHGIIPNSGRYVYDSEAELLRRFVKFIGADGIIVGHHIGFDVEIINRALIRAGAGPLRNRVIDTGQLAQRVQPAGYWTPPETFGLDSLARRYNIPLSDRHTALGDAYITAVLWLKLTGRLGDRVGRALLVEDL